MQVNILIHRAKELGVNILLYHAKEFGLNSTGSQEPFERFATGKCSDLICQLILMALWKNSLERGSRLGPGDMSSSVSSATYPPCFSYCLREWSRMMCASERWVFMPICHQSLEYVERVRGGKTHNPHPALFPP